MTVNIQEFVDKWKIAIPQDMFIEMMKAQLNDRADYQITDTDFHTIQENYKSIYGKVL